jgi:hypothetical protein
LSEDDHESPISQLELGQFGIDYDDLPSVEEATESSDGAMYRTPARPKIVFVYRSKPRPHWDKFLWV